MSNKKPPVDVIVRSWKEEYGVVKTSEKGTKYIIMPSSSMMDNLRHLAKTMHDFGYTFEEMDDHKVSIKIADLCWRDDKITKMSGAEVNRAKFSLAKDWDEAIAKYSGIVISKSTEVKEEYKEAESKKEKPLELDPKDRIKIDTSDVVDAPLDLEFLAEIGVDESFVGGKKDE